MSYLSNDSKESVLVIGSSGLTREQRLLASGSPPVTTGGTIATDNTMAGNQSGNSIGATGVCDCPDSGWIADFLGQS